MMKRKKPWKYIEVTADVFDGEVFLPTKARRKFKLPWRVMGKGLNNAGQINQASGKVMRL
jgi:hypothetical protein